MRHEFLRSTEESLRRRLRVERSESRTQGAERYASETLSRPSASGLKISECCECTIRFRLNAAMRHTQGGIRLEGAEVGSWEFVGERRASAPPETDAFLYSVPVSLAGRVERLPAGKRDSHRRLGHPGKASGESGSCPCEGRAVPEKSSHNMLIFC